MCIFLTKEPVLQFIVWPNTSFYLDSEKQTVWYNLRGGEAILYGVGINVINYVWGLNGQDYGGKEIFCQYLWTEPMYGIYFLSFVLYVVLPFGQIKVNKCLNNILKRGPIGFIVLPERFM